MKLNHLKKANLTLKIVLVLLICQIHSKLSLKDQIIGKNYFSDPQNIISLNNKIVHFNGSAISLVDKNGFLITDKTPVELNPKYLLNDIITISGDTYLVQLHYNLEFISYTRLWGDSIMTKKISIIKSDFQIKNKISNFKMIELNKFVFIDNDHLILVTIKNSQLSVDLKYPFIEEKIKSILKGRQMYVLTSSKAVYFIPRANSELKQMYYFREKVKYAFSFIFSDKMVIITISDKNILKVYSNEKNYTINFIMKIQLSKFQQAFNLPQSNLIFLKNKSTIRIIDIPSLLIKKNNAIESFKLPVELTNLIKIEKKKWGFIWSFLDIDNHFNDVREIVINRLNCLKVKMRFFC